MRRTRITAIQIETALRWFLYGVLLVVALFSLVFPSTPLTAGAALLILALGLIEPALMFLTPGSTWINRRLVLSFLDLFTASSLYLLTGGRNGVGLVLLFSVVALAATRLLIENTLILATIGSLIFSLDLIFSAQGPAFGPNLWALGVNLILSYAIALIIHFAVTGQREAEMRRQQESALADARRMLDQQQMLVELSREITDTASLDAILQIVLRTIQNFIPFKGGSVALIDANNHLFVAVSVPPVDRAVRELRLKAGEGITGWIAENQQPYYAPDLDQETRVQPSFRNIGANANMKSFLGVPLITRGRCIGVLQVDSALPHAFTEEHQRLLQAVAAQVAGAIENAQLYAELRRNIEQLYTLHQIGQAIGASLSPDEVFRVFDLDVEHLCGAEASVISKWNTAGNNLVIQNLNGAPDLLRSRVQPEVKQQVDKITRSGQANSLVIDLPETAGGKLYGQLAPLIVRGRLLGLAEIYSHAPSILSQESSNIFLTLAAQLAVSMENAHLYSELKKREQQLANFVGRLFQAEEGERRRLAYDIHDGLAQLIVSADMHLNNFASMRGEDPELAEHQLDKGLQRLKASLTEARRVVSELRPSTLDDFGLVNTLRRYVEQLAKEQGWDYSFEDNLGEIRLHSTIENGAYRIVQEALSNIRKYSQTQRVEVEMMQDQDHLHIRIQDWGQGFDLEEARQREGHFGLSSMEERARLLGGDFEIESRPGEGARINVNLPCYQAIPTVRG
ncbi:MAG: GAF domain-containing sensor histidine kinase [Anaerolineae bacterium]